MITRIVIPFGLFATLSISASAVNFPSIQEIGQEITSWSLPNQVVEKLVVLAGKPIDRYAVPNIFLEVLIKRSSLFGLIVEVSTFDVQMTQRNAERVITFFYRADGNAQAEALRYWNARARFEPFGAPIQWSEREKMACTSITCALAAILCTSCFMD